MATISQVQEVIYRARFEDQASQAAAAAAKQVDGYNAALASVEQTVTRSTRSAASLISQYDQQTKAANALARSKRDLAAAEAALAADVATGGAKQEALGRTVDALRAKVADSGKALTDSGDAAKKSGDAHADASAKMGLFGLNAQKTGFLVHDATKAIESLTLGMSPLQVAMQHVGQVQGIFGSLGEAVKSIGASFISVPGAMLAATAALVGFGVAAESESRRLGDLRQQLRATHDDYAGLATAADAAAKQVAASTSLSLADARAASQTISSAKLFSGSQADIVELTKTSQDLARVWNTDVATSAKFLADALNDPAKAAKDLAEKGFPGMSLELAHTITNLQAAGQSGQAYAQVMSVIRTGTVGATQDISPLGKALHDLGQTFYSARDGGKSLAQNLGELVDGFAALQVRGLNNIIKLLDEYIAKMQAATKAGNVGNLATRPGGGGVDDFGRLIPSGDATPSSSASASGALAQVNQSIRPLVEAAAKQYQVDVELLARLQRTENQKPIGSDLGGNPVWKPGSTGPDAAQGAMQVKPSTFAGMQALPYGREFQGQALGNNTTNINAGTSHFAYLLDKYKDPYMAVLAWHDGETRIDHMMNGDLNAQGFSYQASREAREQAEAVKSGYAGPGLTGPYRYGVQRPTAAGGYDYISQGGGNLSAVVRNNDLATSQNAFNLAQGVNPLSAQIEKANADIKGLQAGLDLAVKGGDTEEIKRLTDALAAARGRATDLITEQAKLARAAQDAVAPLAAEEGATRTLAVVQQQFVQAARSAGTDVDQGALQAALASKLHELAVAFDDTVKAADRQTAANERIVASVDQSAPSLIAATNREKALAQARNDFLPGPERIAAVDLYTAALNRQSASAADLATVQKSFDQRDQLETLKAETASLGENTNQRDKELALLKEKQVLIRSGADLQSAASKADLANVAAIADATAALNQQKAAMSELSSFFSSTFDQISSAITQAFATGNLAALKFKDIAKSVASAVISEFAKLAILNPLKNFLFGSNDVTLSSVGGVLGNLFGSSSAGTAVSAIGSTVSAGSSLSNLFDQPGTTLDTAGNLVSASSSESTSSGGGFGSLLQGAGIVGTLYKLVSNLGGGSSVLGSLSSTISGLSDSIGSSAAGVLSDVVGAQTSMTATNLALGALGNGVQGVATPAQFAAGVAVTEASNLGLTSAATDAAVAAASQAGIEAGIEAGTSAATSGAIAATQAAANTAIGAATSAIASAVPYIGSAITVISDLAQGNYRGAALVAGGAAIGTLILPGIGTAIGAAIGGLADTFLPHHPLHPFDAAYVDAAGGRFAQGFTANQAETASAGGIVSNFATSMNTFMDKVGIVLANADGHLGAVGNGIAGMVGLVDSPEKLFSQFQFRNSDTDTSQFGVAKGALAGMTFANSQALVDELSKIAGFADATQAIGVKLKAVGTDLTNIQIASVSGANPSSRGTSDNGVQYLNDLRTALNNDLPQHVYANVQALDDEINKVNQFVSGTLPGLLHPIEQTTSSIVDQANKTMTAYQEAINQSLQYGLDNTAVLKDAEEQALLIVRKSGRDQIYAMGIQMSDRLAAAQGGGVQVSAKTALDNVDLQAEQQRVAFSKLFTDTYGDIIKSSQYYADSMAQMEKVLGAERVAASKQAAEQIAAAQKGVDEQFWSVRGRQAALTGNPLDAQTINADAKAANERAAYSQQLLSFYGDSFADTQDYQNRMSELETVEQYERLKIVKDYAAQRQSTEAGLTDQLYTIRARLSAALGDQKDADLLNWAVKAGDERTAYSQQLLAFYGDSFAYTQDYQNRLSELETAQQAERLAIVQKYGAAITGATADQIKSAQGSVASLFGSLTDYLQKLQTGTNSPLSPTAQYDLAKSQFNSVAGAAAAGDATSAGKLTGFSDSFLSASRALNGSGVGYATDFNRVLDAIQSVVQAPVDALTNSFLALQLQQQTDSINSKQDELIAEVRALRREMQMQTGAQMSRAAA